jgi:hypothetical protein
MSETPHEKSRDSAPRPGARRAPWVAGLVRFVLRLLGWQLRGQLPPQFWRTTLVIWAPEPWQARALSWMMPVHVVWLKGEVSDWKSRKKQGLQNFAQGQTNATTTHASPEELLFIQQAAHAAKSRITLCAWEPRRRFVHLHAPFKTSAFSDRDVHYMTRYFKYFRKTTS